MSLNLLTSGANIPGNPPFNIRIKAISSMLEEYTPAIIGVQELTDSMFPYLKDILNKYPYEMSGGQKQRVAAARAIITNPSLILADEPTGALDSKSAKVLLESMEKLNKDLNATIMMVTHDAFTASYADRILFIKDGKIFNELIKGNDSRNKFFDRIIDVITLLGGDVGDVC